MSAVLGIRGSYWQGREEAGRRRSYRVGAARDGAVTVSGEFFDALHRQTYEWLGHLAEEADLGKHLSALPATIAWIADLPVGKMGRDDAARVAAAVLGISERAVYRGSQPRARRGPDAKSL